MELVTLALIFIVAPVSALIWFIVSLVQFLRRDHADIEESKRCRNTLIASSVTLTVILLVIAAFIVLFALAIAHM